MSDTIKIFCFRCHYKCDASEDVDYEDIPCPSCGNWDTLIEGEEQ